MSKFFLTSGRQAREELRSIDGAAVAAAGHGNVLICNMAYLNKEKDKGETLRAHFGELGAKSVQVIDTNTPDAIIAEEFKKCDLLYLPGGDTETLMGNVTAKNLVGRIAAFEGVIVGNSAGAYLLCPEYLKIRENSVEVIPMIGRLPFFMKAHYNPAHEAALTELSKQKEIYALEDPSAIMYDGTMSFTGNVWKFSQEKITRCNN